MYEFFASFVFRWKVPRGVSLDASLLIAIHSNIYILTVLLCVWNGSVNSRASTSLSRGYFIEFKNFKRRRLMRNSRDHINNIYVNVIRAIYSMKSFVGLKNVQPHHCTGHEVPLDTNRPKIVKESNERLFSDSNNSLWTDSLK